MTKCETTEQATDTDMTWKTITRCKSDPIHM